MRYGGALSAALTFAAASGVAGAPRARAQTDVALQAFTEGEGSPLVMLAGGMFGAVAFAPHAQMPAPEPDAWGEPVDGVQLKLAVTQSKPPRVRGGLPPLEARIRNQGSGTATFVSEAIVYPNIEVDGVWYSRAWTGSCCSNPRKIAPGAQSDALLLDVVETDLFELNARPARTLDLRPGKHSIRVRSVSSDLFYVHSTSHRAMVLVSNAITIDIPDR